MTDHPCKGLTRAQIAAFEQIAINQPPRCSERNLNTLLKHGLIERGDDVVRRDVLGGYLMPTFFVPLPVHYQWCTWAGEQFGEEEIG